MSSPSAHHHDMKPELDNAGSSSYPTFAHGFAGLLTALRSCAVTSPHPDKHSHNHCQASLALSFLAVSPSTKAPWAGRRGRGTAPRGGGSCRRGLVARTASAIGNRASAKPRPRAACLCGASAPGRCPFCTPLRQTRTKSTHASAPSFVLLIHPHILPLNYHTRWHLTSLVAYRRGRGLVACPFAPSLHVPATAQPGPEQTGGGSIVCPLLAHHFLIPASPQIRTTCLFPAANP